MKTTATRDASGHAVTKVTIQNPPFYITLSFNLNITININWYGRWSEAPTILFVCPHAKFH